MTKKLLLLIGFFIALQLNAQNIRYVTTTGSGTMDGSSWANAGNDIQLTMNALTSGGEVWIAGGTYIPTRKLGTGAYNPGSQENSFTLRNGVTLRGGFAGTEASPAERNLNNPSQETVLSGTVGSSGNEFADQVNHVVVAVGLDDIAMDGLTIKGGYAINSFDEEVSGYYLVTMYGGGLYLANSTISLSNVKFKENKAYDAGGGIACIQSTINAVSCSFDYDFIDIGNGGALFIFNANSAAAGGTFTNCLFTNNLSESAGAVVGYIDGSGPAPVFTNCTLYNNGSGEMEILNYDSTGGQPMRFNNCIIEQGAGSTRLSWSENLSFQNTLTSYPNYFGSYDPGNIFLGTALFMDAPNGDFRLLGVSAAVNSGNNSLVPAGIVTDAVGNSRIFGGQADRGALENQTEFVLTPDANGRIYVKADSVGYADGGSWANATPDLAKALITAHSNPQVTEIWVAGGTYKPKYRPDNYSGANPYDRLNSFRMVPNVKLYGGFAGTETSLSGRQLLPQNASLLTGDLAGNDVPSFGYRGDNAYHVVTAMSGTDASLLDGFTVTGGNANYPDYDGQWFLLYFYINGEKCLRDSGAGLFSTSSMPVNNVLFTENAALRNGGACNISGNAAIVSCRYIYNVAEDGGGAIHSFGDITVTQSYFSENRSDTFGGVIFAQSGTPVFTNCIFTGNKSVQQSGIIACGFSEGQAPITFTNCTIAGNGLSSAPHTLFTNIIPHIRNSIISKPYNAAANTRISDNINGCVFQYVLSTYPLGTNPLNQAPFTTNNIYFTNESAGDFTLKSYSQAINTGNNAFAAGLSKDYAGNNRILYEDVDMGAIENVEQALPVPDYQGIVYVKLGSMGNGKGNSWTNARPELADALLAAKHNSAIKQIWVAGGTYKPMYEPENDYKVQGARRNTFLMVPNVKIYGGFAGNETTLAERDLGLVENESILSVDFNGDDNPDSFDNYYDNAFHVVLAADDVGTAELNGFTVTGGNGTSANNDAYIVYGHAIQEYRGGGLYINSASPAITNVNVIKNMTSWSGGGALILDGAPTFTGTSFKNNACYSEDTGGGLAIYNGISERIVFSNCFFYKNLNYGLTRGGEILFGASTEVDNAPLFNNCTFIIGSDGVYNLWENVPIIGYGEGQKTMAFNNCMIIKPDEGDINIFVEAYGIDVVMRNSFTNYSSVSNNAGNTGNVYAANPFFNEPENGDYTLRSYSLALNIGNNAYAAGLETDLAGNPRIQYGTVDPGAFETSKQAIPKPDANGIVYVSQNATGTGEGNSWDNARAELADALLAAQFNPAIQEIWVAGGKYTPKYHPLTFDYDPDRTNAFVMKAGVKLYGGFAGNEISLSERNLALTENASVLSGDFNSNDPNYSDDYGYDFTTQQENAYHVVIAAGPMGDAVLDGFTVTGGHADGDASLTLNGENITGQYGGGLYMTGGILPLDHVTFLYNFAEEKGGGVYLDAESPYITSGLFNFNVAPNGAGLYNTYGSPVLTNTVFFQNSASVAGGGIYNDGGTPVLTNMTMMRNHAEDGNSGAVYNKSAVVAIRNSILCNNNGNVYDDGGTSEISYSYVQYIPGGENGNLDGNIYFGNWMFEGEFNGNFTPVYSMFAGLGSNDYFAPGQTPDLSAIVTDYKGGQRFYGTVDMGAIETDMLPYPVADANGIVYVKTDGLGDGTSWENATNNIQDAMYADGVQQIWVAGGTYKPIYTPSEFLTGDNTDVPRARTFLLLPDIKIYGGFAGTETSLEQRGTSIQENPSILSGDLNNDDMPGNFGSRADNSYHVVLCIGPVGETLLDGFTITGGNADGTDYKIINGLSIQENKGGGINVKSSSPQLNHLIFKDNYGLIGAGMSTDASNTLITNSLFYDNIGTYGGAIGNWGSSPVITNVTITANQADFGAGIYNEYSDTALNNTIVYGNEGNGVYNVNSQPVWRYCLIQDFSQDAGWNDEIGINGSNNQAVYTMYNDPVFNDPENNDYTLNPSSVALNTGDDSLFPNAAAGFDLAGNARVYGPIDLGAYELIAITACTAATAWTGSEWTNGAPTSEMYKAEIFANYDSALHGDITACSLTIHNGDVIISSGGNFIINGQVWIAETASLTVAHNANLIQVDPSVVNETVITVIKESAPMYRLDYALWGSPVGDQKLKDFSPQTLDNRFYTYNPLTDGYSVVSSPANTDFEEGKGYLIRVSNTHPAYVSNDIAPTPWEGTFNGVPNNGTINVPVTSYAAPAGENEGVQGFNAVSNPYPSSINIKAFFEANQGNLAANSPIYFWRKKNEAGTSSYCSLTLAGYNRNSGNAFGDSSNGLFDDPDNSDNWVINSGQGFIVQAASGTISFNNSMRVAVNNGQMFRSAMNDSDKSRLWLNLTNAQGDFGQATIVYTAETTLGLDYGWDGLALTDGKVAIYSLAGESKLGIQARPAFNVADEVPIGCKITTAGNYTISLDHFDGVFAEGQEIYLRDNLLGLTHNLETPYDFSAEAGALTGRFDVIYAEPLAVETPTFNSNSIIVYKQDNAINIRTGTTDMKSVSVYDIRGRLLYNSDNVNAAKASITTLQAEQQMLIVEVTTTDGLKASRKIVF